MEFVVHKAAACRHPLHFTSCNRTATTCGVAVRDFTLVGNGDSFKAAMRVTSHAARRSAVATAR